jgi:hypothetical protein
MSRMCTKSSLYFECTHRVFFHSWINYTVSGRSVSGQILQPTSRIRPMTLPVTIGGRSGNRRTSSLRNSLVLI